MGDLLIRDIDDNLKRELEERAKQNGRTLSEEAAELIHRTLSKKQTEGAGNWLREALGEERLTEEEVAAINSLRHEPDRDPPRFDE